jgi:hypothetical protein
MARRVALVSCVKSKQLRPALAKDLYTSALFTKARAWAERNCDEWFILSAKYGFVNPDQMLEPYEMTLNTMRTGERRQWADRVFRQMDAAGVLSRETTFVWLAGSNYKSDLARLLNGYEQADPMEGLGIGKRLQWLSRPRP